MHLNRTIYASTQRLCDEMFGHRDFTLKIKPGIYEVAFAYSDDTDIPINLSQISAATGLDMPEG